MFDAIFFAMLLVLTLYVGAFMLNLLFFAIAMLVTFIGWLYEVATNKLKGGE